MKKTLSIFFLALAITISVPSPIKADEITKPKQITLVEAPKNVQSKYVNYFVMVYDAFPNDPVMIKIANSESSFNPKNKNPNSTAKGLFQILDSTWKNAQCVGDPYDPQDNIDCAWKLYKASGTKPWNASKDNWS